MKKKTAKKILPQVHQHMFPERSVSGFILPSVHLYIPAVGGFAVIQSLKFNAVFSRFIGHILNEATSSTKWVKFLINRHSCFTRHVTLLTVLSKAAKCQTVSGQLVVALFGLPCFWIVKSKCTLNLLETIFRDFV